MDHIYLDHNASTAVRPEVVDAIASFFKENYGNPSSVHQFGQRTRKVIEEARVRCAKFINAADPNEIVFTSGGTESNNMVLKGVYRTFCHQGRRIVSSAIEHSAIRQVLQHMVETDGTDYVPVPVQKGGYVKVEDVDDAITPDTILVSIMLANNETGVIQPIEEIAKICKRKNVLFHTDAVQAAGKYPIDVQKLGVDMLTVSGHKFGAPKGVGFLYLKKGTKIDTLVHGGSQEKNRRGGTENVSGIVGLGLACELANKDMNEETQRLAYLRDLLESFLTSKIPHTFVNGDRTRRTCNTTNICFDYTDSSELVMALDMKGVAVSNGSACASGNPEPSHVLLAMGLPQHQAHASIRFSVGHNTTEEDIQRVCGIIPTVVQRLRDKHPLWKEAV